MQKPAHRSGCLRTFACPFCVGSLKPANIVETAIGPLLTTSGRWPGESCQLRPELAEGNSLDEALNARAPSLLCSAPRESLDPREELSIKLAQRTILKSPKLMLLPEHVDAWVKYRGRSFWWTYLCLKMCLLILLPRKFETDEVCYSVHEVCISFGVVLWSN